MGFSKIANTIFKNFIMAITLIQVVFAIIWIIMNAAAGKTTVFGIIYFLAFLVLSVLVFLVGKRTAAFILAYIISMPLVLHTMTSDGHVLGMPEAPAGDIKQLFVQRLAWPELRGMEELYDAPDWANGLLVAATCDPKAMWTELFPEVETHMGPSELNRISESAINYALANNKRGIVLSAAAEGVSYVFSPVAVLYNLSGSDGSRSGINYAEFVSLMPKLFGFYFKFGCIAWIFALLTGLFSVFTSQGRKHIIGCFLILLLFVFYNLFFPVRGFDYKNSVYIIVTWLFFLSGSVRREDVNC